MKYFLWRIRLSLLSWRYRYAADWWRPHWHFAYCMQYDCWRGFFDDGYSPRDALSEDASA